MTDHCPSCPFKGCKTCRYQGDAHFQAAEAMSGDYDNVLRTAMRWVETA